MAVAWPERLIADLARRRVALVIGAGVSRHAIDKKGERPPLWRNFLENSLDAVNGGNKEHIEKALAENDLLHACEWIKKRYAEGWVEHLRSTFISPIFKPTQIHSDILSLDQRLLFTLNFDDIIERTAVGFEKNAYVIKRHCDADVSEVLRGDGRYIVKVHGSLNTPNQLVFTQGEYAKARVHHQNFYTAFDAALMTHTFLFIGCGTSDPDIALLLENQAFGQNADVDIPHYFLSASGMNSDLRNSLLINRGLKVVDFEPQDELYTGLSDEINKLVTLVENAREKLVDSQNW
jgi:hypothetical protein